MTSAVLCRWSLCKRTGAICMHHSLLTCMLYIAVAQTVCSIGCHVLSGRTRHQGIAVHLQCVGVPSMRELWVALWARQMPCISRSGSGSSRFSRGVLPSIFDVTVLVQRPVIMHTENLVISHFVAIGFSPCSAPPRTQVHVARSASDQLTVE